MTQGLGGLLIRKIEGDYNNVVGFPAASFFKFLEHLVDEDPDFLEVWVVAWSRSLTWMDLHPLLSSLKRLGGTTRTVITIKASEWDDKNTMLQW